MRVLNKQKPGFNSAGLPLQVEIGCSRLNLRLSPAVNQCRKLLDWVGVQPSTSTRASRSAYGSWSVHVYGPRVSVSRLIALRGQIVAVQRAPRDRQSFDVRISS
jgi:hypothetical protein